MQKAQTCKEDMSFSILYPLLPLGYRFLIFTDFNQFCDAGGYQDYK